MSWFSDIYGFEESTYARTQAKFCIDGPLLHTRGQSSRTFHGTADVVASAAQVVSSWGFSITPDTLNQIASEVGEQSIISRAGGPF